MLWEGRDSSAWNAGPCRTVHSAHSVYWRLSHVPYSKQRLFLNWLLFVIGIQSVFWKVETNFLYIHMIRIHLIQINFVVQRMCLDIQNGQCNAAECCSYCGRHFLMACSTQLSCNCWSADLTTWSICGLTSRTARLMTNRRTSEDQFSAPPLSAPQTLCSFTFSNT
jgi:hypothetical protein